MPSTAGSALSRSTSASSVRLGRISGSLCSKLPCRLERLLALVADIDLARRIFAHQHHGKTRPCGPRSASNDAAIVGHARAQPFGEGLAVDPLCFDSSGNWLLKLATTNRTSDDTAQEQQHHRRKIDSARVGQDGAWIGRQHRIQQRVESSPMDQRGPRPGCWHNRSR
jgi:hypothetical protein